MRTKKDIKDQMTNRFISDKTVQKAYKLDQKKTFEQEFSKVSLENILFEVFAFAVYFLEQVFGRHRSEIDSIIANQKSGTLAWYRYKALQFLYGFDLLPNSDKFNTKGSNAEQIAKAKIIQYAAVTEGDKPGLVVIKIAGEQNQVLKPISKEAQGSVEAYFKEIKFAGTRINIINTLPDKLSLNIKIYRDPLVLDSQGNSIKNADKPVEIALKNFIKKLPFNGELILQNLVDALQVVEGVKIAHLINVETSWLSTNSGGYGDRKPVEVKYLPTSGYFEIDNFDDISYVDEN